MLDHRIHSTSRSLFHNPSDEVYSPNDEVYSPNDEVHSQWQPHVNTVAEFHNSNDEMLKEQSQQEEVVEIIDHDLDIEVPTLPPPIFVTPNQNIESHCYKPQPQNSMPNPRLQPLQLSNKYVSRISSAPITSKHAVPQPCTRNSVFSSFSPFCSQPPQCLSIEGKKKKDRNISLSSLDINKENLLPTETIIKKYPSLRHENVIGKLAVKLARECFFGNEVLARCTVMGCRDYPALPVNELNELKQLIFSMFPAYWNSPIEFESKIWNICANSIGQLCKRLRSMNNN